MKTQMTTVKIKADFELSGNEDDGIKQSINQKFADKIIEYPTVPRIGEWIDLLELSHGHDLSQEESKWLAAVEHKFSIENVKKCEGYIEAELDMDKVWPEEA